MRKQALHFRQYFNVLLVIALVIIFEIQIPFVRKELLGTPFLLVITGSAVYGDFYSGVLALLVGSLSAGFVSSMAWRLHTHDVIQIVGVLLAGLIIYALAWRGRNLFLRNMSLSGSLDQTEKSLKKLKDEVKVNKKHLAKASELNKELRKIVDNIMEDQKLWGEHVKSDVSKTETRRKKA